MRVLVGVGHAGRNSVSVFGDYSEEEEEGEEEEKGIGYRSFFTV